MRRILPILLLKHNLEINKRLHFHFGCHFGKLNAHTAKLRRFAHFCPIFLTFCPDFRGFCPDCHQLITFGGAVAPPPPTQVAFRGDTPLGISQRNATAYTRHQQRSGLGQFDDAVSATGRFGDGGRKCFMRKNVCFEILWRLDYKGCLLRKCFCRHSDGHWPVLLPVRQDFGRTWCDVTTCAKKCGLWRLFLLAWGVCEFTQKLSLDSINFLIFHVDRGASRGSVWLSWQTPLYRRYSALKTIKYQTLSLQVSNAGGLEQATAYISLVTLHSIITKQQRPCLVWTAPAQWHETIHVFEHSQLILRRKQVLLNFLLWQCRL